MTNTIIFAADVTIRCIFQGVQGIFVDVNQRKNPVNTGLSDTYPVYRGGEGGVLNNSDYVAKGFRKGSVAHRALLALRLDLRIRNVSWRTRLHR